MAFTYKIIKEEQKKWRYEVYIETFEIDIHKGDLTVFFPKKPSNDYLGRECQRRTDAHEQKLLNPDIAEKSYLQSEVTEILKDKGYLQEDGEFSEEMPEKTESKI